MEADTRIEDTMEHASAIEETGAVVSGSRPALQNGSLSRPARRDSVRGSGTRRRSTRVMRDIIKALTESMHALAQEERDATGCESLKTAPTLRPIEYEATSARCASPKSSLLDRFDASLSALPTDADLVSNRPARIKLLRSQDLWSESHTSTELTCDFCHGAFCLQDGGATFEGKSACSNCEQRLNRDVVLPALGQIRPQLREVCTVATVPHQVKRPAWIDPPLSVDAEKQPE